MRWDGKRWSLHPIFKGALHDDCRGPLVRVKSAPVRSMGAGAVRVTVRCAHDQEFTLPVGMLRPLFEEVSVCPK